MVSRNTLHYNRMRNALQTFLILGLMGLLFSLIGYLFGGAPGLVIALLTFLMVSVAAPQVSPALVLRMYGARRIDPAEAPGLYRAAAALAERASLGRTPVLYYIPSRMMNAFTVGGRDNAVIAMTDGILRAMNLREMAGILAHEISHIENNDLRVMSLADSITRMINFFSYAGFLLMLIYLPVMLSTGIRISLPAIALLAFSPQLSMLLQLALSRTREFDADLNAVKLTGDPEGLASALAKIESRPRSLLDILIPGRSDPAPSLLRSHPHTARRLERLKKLSGPEYRHGPMEHPPRIFPDRINAVTDKPRWRIGGLWH